MSADGCETGAARDVEQRSGGIIEEKVAVGRGEAQGRAHLGLLPETRGGALGAGVN